MCGIAGFSLVAGSKVNARELAHALLSEAEVRGKNASGFGFATRDGRRGLHKGPVVGRDLDVSTIPEDADAVIIHTRMATHGSHEVNANNHPVESPDQNIMLTHNGVIWNHEEVRKVLGKGKTVVEMQAMMDARLTEEGRAEKLSELAEGLPEVDTSVLPAMLQERGIEGMEVVAGDAAIAWLDTSTSNTLHLAKLSSSPVVYAFLTDGSFVYASTAQILGKALNTLNLSFIGAYPDIFDSMYDSEYVQVTDGRVEMMDEAKWNDDYFRPAYNWRAVTSGSTNLYGSSRTTHHTPSKAITAMGTPPKGSEDKYTEDPDADIPGDFDDEGYWWNEGGKTTTTEPSVLGPDKFYVLDHDGDYQGFRTVVALVGMLRWYSSMSGGENHLIASGPERWINHFLDIGELRDDNSMSSWITNPEDSREFDPEIEGGLEFVRNGIAILAAVTV